MIRWRAGFSDNDEGRYGLLDTIGVLVADDKEFMRQALTRLIETEEHLELVGTAVNGEDAVKKAAEIKPRVVVMDIRMPGLNGIEASHRIVADNPGTGIVIVSSFDDTEYVLDLLKNGPDGKAYILKQSIDSSDDLAHAIKAVASGRTVLDLAIGKKLAQHHFNPDLTLQEQSVLALLAKGLSDGQIRRVVSLDMKTLIGILDTLSDKIALYEEDPVRRNVCAVLTLLGSPHDPFEDRPLDGSDDMAGRILE